MVIYYICIAKSFTILFQLFFHYIRAKSARSHTNRQKPAPTTNRYHLLAMSILILYTPTIYNKKNNKNTICYIYIWNLIFIYMPNRFSIILYIYIYINKSIIIIYLIVSTFFFFLLLKYIKVLLFIFFYFLIFFFFIYFCCCGHLIYMYINNGNLYCVFIYATSPYSSLSIIFALWLQQQHIEVWSNNICQQRSVPSCILYIEELCCMYMFCIFIYYSSIERVSTNIDLNYKDLLVPHIWYHIIYTFTTRSV